MLSNNRGAVQNGGFFEFTKQFAALCVRRILGIKDLWVKIYVNRILSGLWNIGDVLMRYARKILCGQSAFVFMLEDCRNLLHRLILKNKNKSVKLLQNSAEER